MQSELEWSRTVFEQTSHRFIDYYMEYLTVHNKNWLALEIEHQNLVGLTTQLQENDDDKNLLVVRDFLQPYLDLRGYWSESIDLNNRAIRSALAIGDYLSAARFTHDRANIFHQAGDYSQAEQLYKESENAYRSLGNNEMALHSRHMRSLIVRARGRLGEAEKLCKTTFDEAKALGLSTWLAHPLYVMGLIARDLGNYQKARTCVEQSLALLSAIDDKAVVAQCYHFLGELDLMTGKFNSAHSLLEKSLQLSREVGILRRVAATTRLIGDLASAEGKAEEAERHYDDAIDISMNLSDRPELAKAFMSKAKLCFHLDDEQKAIALFEKASSIYAVIGDPRGRTLALYYLFRLYIKQGEFIAAIKCLIFATRSSWDARLFTPRYLRIFLRHGVK